MDKDQKMRYSEAEKAIIKKTFKDQNDLRLYALRNLFWQLELTEEEKQLLDFDAEQLKIIKKVMLPDIEKDVPLGQQVDFTNDPLLFQINQMNPAIALIMADANDLRIRYLEQQFYKLINWSEDTIILKELRKPMSIEQDSIRHINLLAYKSIKDYIDGRIYEFKVIANPPEELTPEQRKEKEKKNSTQ